MRKIKNVKKIAILGLFSSLALVLSYLEAILPPLYAAVPGIKMGLPNILIIVVLYRFGVKDAIAVSVIRLFAVALLFGNAMTLMYSVAGAFLSLLLMSVLKHFDLFSTIGISIIGGISHNLGQIIVAILLLRTPQIGYYMIVLTISGTIAGMLVGLAAHYFMNKLRKLNF